MALGLIATEADFTPVVGLFIGLLEAPILEADAGASFFVEDGSTKSYVVAVALVLCAAGLFTIIPYFLASASFITELSPPLLTLSYID